MSSGTQVDLDRTGGADAPQPGAPNGTGSRAGTYLTDEEILGMDPLSPNGSFGGQARQEPNSEAASRRDSSGNGSPRNDAPAPHDGFGAQAQVTQAGANEMMPAWMQTLAGDPQHGAEAQQLWQEHQEFRAAFTSPAEARAIKDLFPGGAQEARTLRQAAQAVDQIDAAIYSGDARAQSEVVAELARANPAAFRSLFAEAAKVLASMGQAQPVTQGGPTLREGREGWGTEQNSPQQTPVAGHPPSAAKADFGEQPNHQSPVTSHPSQDLRASQLPNFDPAAYASFERSTNDAVARDVRSTIQDTLTRVLPEGVAEGASRRIGDDIFNEVHRALAADRTLSERVGDVLRDRRFGAAEQQRVSSMLAGRAKQLVPSVARRVIGEWTSSVLGTARTKTARQAAAAARVDIAAPGGSLDSMPLRPMSSREVNYASMSDDDILGM